VSDSVAEELSNLRKQGLAKSQSDKFRDAGMKFLTPEEAHAYIAQHRSKTKYDNNVSKSSLPPSNLNSSDLDDWYTKQKKLAQQEAKRKAEAEAFLRSYRSTGIDKSVMNGNSKGGSNGENGTMNDSTSVDGSDASSDTLSPLSPSEKLKEELKLGSISNVKSIFEKNETISEEDESVENNGADLKKEGTSKGMTKEETSTSEATKEVTQPQEISMATVKDENLSNKEKDADNDDDIRTQKARNSILPSTIISTSANNTGPTSPSSSDGKESRGDTNEVTESEENSRTSEIIWKNWISPVPDAKFKPEPNRYHLYVSHACPWSHRTTIVLALKGLQKVVGVTYVHPTWQYTRPGQDEHRGWVFGTKSNDDENGDKSKDTKDETFYSNTDGFGKFPCSWGEVDPHYGLKSIRDLYEKANDTSEKYTIPILWDTELNTIVSNDSADIIRMLNMMFNDYATNPTLDLYPEEKREEIDQINDWIYPTINDGVYRCGLAGSQENYDIAIDELSNSFDRIDSIFQKQQFLAEGTITEADVRLFVTLLRFDEVYNLYFMTNTRFVAATPSVLDFVRRIYKTKDVASTCNMDMIKAHYYTSHVEFNR